MRNAAGTPDFLPPVKREVSETWKEGQLAVPCAPPNITVWRYSLQVLYEPLPPRYSFRAGLAKIFPALLVVKQAELFHLSQGVVSQVGGGIHMQLNVSHPSYAS